MTTRIATLVALFLAATLAVAACGGQEPAEEAASLTTAPAGEAAVGGTVDAASGMPTEEAPVAMIASGSATAPPVEATVEVARPAPAEGVQRAVELDEAREKFTPGLLEPQTLPENTFLTIIQLIETAAGDASATLPAVRLIYDVEGRGALVLYQSPATGEPFEGEALSVGGRDAGVSAMDQGEVLTTEIDDVRVEVRATGLDRETLVQIVESLAAGSE